MAELKLTYGKDSNGRLVHVDDVPSGLACNCTCPECRAQLIARKGKKNQHHFAHPHGSDCTGARMTALHMLAQQIIQGEKKIRTPWFKDYYEDPSKLIYFESVSLEQRIETTEINRRPDCVGIIKNGDKQYEVWIEVKVKHAIDEEKKKDIECLGAICMEVDLSSLLKVQYTERSIQKALFDVYDNKEWINYPALKKKNEAERKKQEEEEYKTVSQDEQEWQELETIENLVDGWMNGGLVEDADKLIEEIEQDPYRRYLNCQLVDIILPNYNILSWITVSPKYPNTIKLFYTILKYYISQIQDNIDRKLIDTRLNEFRFKQFVTEQEKIELELLISLKIVCTLRYQYHPYPYVYYFDEKKELYKKYISDEVFRNKCLKLLSIEYRHIVGSESKDFLTLTEEIRRFYPCILPLYIAIIEYTYTTKRPKFGIPKLEEESIVEAKKIVGNMTVEEDCYQLFDSVFGYLIKNHSFKRRKVVQKNQNDIPDSQTQMTL